MLSACFRRTQSLLLNARLRKCFAEDKPTKRSMDNGSTLVETPSITSRILTLQQFINKRVQSDPKNLLENSPEEIFVYGVHPLKLKNYLFAYFKYGFWQREHIGEQKILSFIEKMKEQEVEIKALFADSPSHPQALERQQLLISYQRYISTALLPATIAQMSICEPYIRVLITYLETSGELNEVQLRYVFQNLEHIIYEDEDDQQYISDREYGWLMISCFDLIVTRLKGKFQELLPRYKSLIIRIAKTLRLSNLHLLEFIKNQLQQQRKQITFYQFLAGLNLLAINRSFPYEYFYKNKESLMDLIEAAEPLSQKKVKNSLALLEIFSRQRLMYCEKIIDRLLDCIEHNLVASDLKQVTRILYFYSKLKSTIKHEFVIKLVDRITLFMDILSERDYSLIVRSLANLNYKDEDLVDKLKDFNYELFLTNLKYGCEKLGSYYKAILDEIENSFKNDTLRYERQEDEIFQEIVFQPSPAQSGEQPHQLTKASNEKQVILL